MATPQSELQLRRLCFVERLHGCVAHWRHVFRGRQPQLDEIVCLRIGLDPLLIGHIATIGSSLHQPIVFCVVVRRSLSLVHFVEVQ